jgi:hypothetical protein
VKKRRKQSARTTRDEDFEAFWRALPELLKTNPGLFVAFSGGQLIDNDPDEFALAKRVAREHAGKGAHSAGYRNRRACLGAAQSGLQIGKRRAHHHRAVPPKVAEPSRYEHGPLMGADIRGSFVI